MDVIYLDSLFGLNLLIDYCLVLASARVCGVVLRRWRYALAALIGALYAALMVLPGCGWLANGTMKLALGAAMALIAFGGETHLTRCTVVFFAVSAAFGGAVYAASMLAGVSPGSGALVTVSGRVLALSFAACYAAVSLVFRRRAKAANREVRTVTVTLAGRSVTLKALRDSGNDLHDPVSGLPAAVVERAAVLPLFPALHALPDDAQMPFASSRSSRLSPSTPSKQKLTLPGKRFTGSPLSALCGILDRPSIRRSRRALTLFAFSSRCAQASSSAAAMPMMAGMFSVPARLPRSCEPPPMRFVRKTP